MLSIKFIFFIIFKSLLNGYFSYKYNSFRKKYQIHKSFFFNGVFIDFYGNGNLFIDQNSYIGNFSSIQITKGYFVRIGKNCSLSHNVRIYTSNLDPVSIINQDQFVKIKAGDVNIGDYTWVGANVIILQGVTIGKNCVIGANSVVTKNVDDCSVAAGNPIKILKRKQN
jgi:maltose O-acetyltransferase